MSVSDVKKYIERKEIKVVFIADDVKNLTEFGIFHNTTFSLMIAAQELGLRVFLTETNNLKIINNEIVSRFDEVVVKREVSNHLKIISSSELSLDSFEIIFARKDPPVDSNFLSYLQILSILPPHVLVINNPCGILRANEKLYVFNVPSFIPITLVSSNKKEIIDFLQEHKEVVIKPLFHKGGEGVLYLKADDDFSSTIDESLSNYQRIIVQKYLPDVMRGDKRIILFNGEPVGGIIRIPKPGEFRAHISRGASFKQLTLSKRDLEICTALKPFLLRDGIYFAAIDIIGDYLIEVNVTCPANLYETEQSIGKPLTKMLVEWAVKLSTSCEELAVNNAKS